MIWTEAQVDGIVAGLDDVPHRALPDATVA